MSGDLFDALGRDALRDPESPNPDEAPSTSAHSPFSEAAINPP